MTLRDLLMNYDGAVRSIRYCYDIKLILLSSQILMLSLTYSSSLLLIFQLHALRVFRRWLRFEGIGVKTSYVLAYFREKDIIGDIIGTISHLFMSQRGICETLYEIYPCCHLLSFSFFFVQTIAIGSSKIWL